MGWMSYSNGGPTPQTTIARDILRPLGSPLPLGFIGFAMGTLVFSGFELGWVPATQGKQVAILMLGGIFPAQFVSALMAFLTRDTTGATVLALLSASWLGLGLVFLTLPPGGTSAAAGLYLVGLTGALIIFGLLAFMGKSLFGIAMLIAVPRYLLIGLYELNGNVGLEHASGIVGLVLAGVATYGGIALLVEDATQRTILPIGRRGHSRSSLEGELSNQLERLAREPGVRSQL
jgi:succinate-acetate transporter protein